MEYDHIQSVNACKCIRGMGVGERSNVNKFPYQYPLIDVACGCQKKRRAAFFSLPYLGVPTQPEARPQSGRTGNWDLNSGPS